MAFCALSPENVHIILVDSGPATTTVLPPIDDPAQRTSLRTRCVTLIFADGQPRVHDDQVGEDLRRFLDHGEADEAAPVLADECQVSLQVQFLHQLPETSLESELLAG